MPSGRVHNLINIAAFAGLSAAALSLTHTRGLVITPLQALSFSVGYGVGTFLLSPDLDLSEGHVDSKRRWGPLGFLWVPYGMLFSHRGLSHTWILGPLTRLVYLALMTLLVWGLFHYLALSGVWPRGLFPQGLSPRGLALSSLPLTHQFLGFKFAYPLLAGYYLSQWLHLIADGIRPDHGLRHGGRKMRETARRFR